MHTRTHTDQFANGQRIGTHNSQGGNLNDHQIYEAMLKISSNQKTVN